MYINETGKETRKNCARKFAKETAIRVVCVKYFYCVESRMTN